MKDLIINWILYSLLIICGVALFNACSDSKASIDKEQFKFKVEVTYQDGTKDTSVFKEPPKDVRISGDLLYFDNGETESFAQVRHFRIIDTVSIFQKINLKK